MIFGSPTRWLLAPILIVALLVGTTTADSYGAVAPPPASTPIKHIVIIMQENHSFDNFFGTFPGVAAGYSLPLDYCLPKNLTNSAAGCELPFSADSEAALFQTEGLCHLAGCSRNGYNDGKMNGFYVAQLESVDAPFASDTMGYFTGATIPDYWDYASEYGLDANFFSSSLSFSYPNHLFLVAAKAPEDCAGKQGCPVQFDLSYPTIVSELSKSGLSWRYFNGDWNDDEQCQPITQKYAGAFWNTLPDFPAVQLGKNTCGDIQGFSDLYQDLSVGYLPQVTWITPNQTVSDHPGPDATLPKGQEYIAQIVDQIASNATLWKSTAIFITWDEAGGYYDNVAPSQVDNFGYGFRVPLIVISPFVKQGVYYGNPTGAQADFTALLKTIEVNWGLPPLTQRDATVASLFGMFNFSQPPLPPLILPTNSLASYPVSTCSTCHAGAVQPRQSVPTTSSPLNASAPSPANDAGINFSTTHASVYSNRNAPIDNATTPSSSAINAAINNPSNFIS